MEGSSKQDHSRLHPPSPIDEEYPPTPSPRSHAAPVSPWIRKPDPERLAHLQSEGQLHIPEPDLESGPSEQKPKRRIICGCSKSTFIIVVFFLIVIIAAAIGGGVGGTIFSDKRLVCPAPLLYTSDIARLGLHWRRNGAQRRWALC